jgi:hypothetical protein
VLDGKPSKALSDGGSIASDCGHELSSAVGIDGGGAGTLRDGGGGGGATLRDGGGGGGATLRDSGGGGGATLRDSGGGGGAALRDVGDDGVGKPCGAVGAENGEDGLLNEIGDDGAPANGEGGADARGVDVAANGDVGGGSAIGDVSKGEPTSGGSGSVNENAGASASGVDFTAPSEGYSADASFSSTSMGTVGGSGNLNCRRDGGGGRTLDGGGGGLLTRATGAASDARLGGAIGAVEGRFNVGGGGGAFDPGPRATTPDSDGRVDSRLPSESKMSSPEPLLSPFMRRTTRLALRSLGFHWVTLSPRRV